MTPMRSTRVHRRMAADPRRPDGGRTGRRIARLRRAAAAPHAPARATARLRHRRTRQCARPERRHASSSAATSPASARPPAAASCSTRPADCAPRSSPTCAASASSSCPTAPGLLRRRALQRRRRRAAPNLAHVLADGSVDPAFAPVVDNDVLTMVLHEGRLYVGGDFLHVGDVIRRRIAALDPATGAVDRRLQPRRRQERPGPRDRRQPAVRQRALHRHRRPEPQFHRRPGRDERAARPGLRRGPQRAGRRRARARYALLHRRRVHGGQRP